MKVLLIVPEYSGRFSGKLFPHTGIAYLTGLLQRHTIQVKIVDMNLGYSIANLFAALDSFVPEIVGITSYSFKYKEVYTLIDAIKTIKPYKIVVGGPHVSATRKAAMEETATDFAIKGEGEFTLLELCRTLESPNPNYYAIQGLFWRSNGDIVENDDRPPNNNLDALPLPAYEAFELNRYLCHIDKQLPIVTSRGCPYHCTFCSVQLAMGRNFRARSPVNVVSEIKHWYNKGWNHFEFQDDCFSFDIARAKVICDLIIEKGIEINWSLSNGIRVDRLDMELLRKMKQSGCVRLAFGVESANNNVLKNIKKGIKIEQIEKSIRMVKEAGINLVGFFIIGLPGETYESFMKTLKFAVSMPFNQINFYNLQPYPGTELLKWVKENSTFLVPEEDYLNDISAWDNQPVFETTDFSKEERKKALKKGFSLHRKSIAQFKIGKSLGYIVWILTSHHLLEQFLIRTFKTTPIGRRVYKFISSFIRTFRIPFFHKVRGRKKL